MQAWSNRSCCEEDEEEDSVMFEKNVMQNVEMFPVGTKILPHPVDHRSPFPRQRKALKQVVDLKTQTAGSSSFSTSRVCGLDPVAS